MDKNFKLSRTTNPNDPNNPNGIHAYYLNIIENMPNNVYWLDKNCIAQGCNKNVLKFLGLKKFEDFIGITYEEMGKLANWTEDQAQSFKRDDMEVIATGKAKMNVEEPPFYDEEGNVIYYLSTRIPLFEQNGEVIGVVGISVDITHEKKAKEALKEANRAARLELIYTASHEVRGPLSCVAMLAEHLGGTLAALQDNLSTNIAADKQTSIAAPLSQTLIEALDNCQNIQSSAEDAMRAIQNISTLHHMQLMGVTANPTLCSIQSLIDIALSKSTYPNTHHLIVEKYIDPTMPQETIIDADNVMSALSIVIGNAFRFSRPGGKIQITAKKSPKNTGTCLVISVQDFGVGMYQEQIENLLTTLQNAEKKSPYSKPSIQLSCVKVYLEASKGKLEIKSVPNQGTEVKLMAPYQLPTQKKSRRKRNLPSATPIP